MACVIARLVRLLVWIGAATSALGPAHAREATPREVLVLPSAAAPAAKSSFGITLVAFQAALAVQLAPHRINVSPARGLVRGTSPDTISAARELIARDPRQAVVWYEDRRDQVMVFVLDVTALHRAPIGPLPREDVVPGTIERVMAVAAKTMILRTMPTLPRPIAPQAKPSPGAQETVKPPQRPRRRWALSAGYAADLGPNRGEWLHGPELGVIVRPWSGLELRCISGYRFAQQDTTPAGSWRVDHYQVRVAAGWRWGLSPRWTVVGGAQVLTELSPVRAESPEGAIERDTLWELGTGAWGAAQLRLTRRFSLDLAARTLWLPLSRRLAIAGQEVMGTNRIAIGGAISALWHAF